MKIIFYIMKKELKKKIFLLVIGVFFIAYAIFSYAVNIHYGRDYEMFWLCYLGLLLAGIGMVTSNSLLILAQLNFLLIPDIFWNIDYIHHLIFGKTLMGIIDYFTLEKNPFFHYISLQHVVFIPLALISLYLIRLNNKKAWIFSILEAGLMFPLAWFLTPEKNNVDCVFRSCAGFDLPVPYFLGWMLIFGSVIIISNIIITSFPFFMKNKKI